MVTKGVFFFNFDMEYHEDVEQTLSYGFTFDFGGQPVWQFDEIQPDEQFDLEEKYGVHDWFNMPDDRVIGVGFSSYEVKREDIPALMDDWRDVFENMCDWVGPVVRFESDFECSDYDIYELIEDCYAK